MKRSLLSPAIFTSGALLLFAQGTAWAQEAAASPAGRSAAEVAQAASQVAASGEKPPMTLLELVFSGGWTMVPLVALSIATVMLVVVYIMTLRRTAIATAPFMNTAEVLLKKRDYSGLLAISSRHNELIARVIQRMLDFTTRNPDASFEVVREIAQTEGASQAASLQNRITYLADIAVLAPMVGLLGTVFGIIRSFGVMASNVSQETRPVLLAQGVSEALVATGAGLIVGIVAMGFYGLFRNRVQHLISDLERASAHALGLLALNFREEEEGVAAPSRERARSNNRSERPERATPIEESGSPGQGRPRIPIDDEF